MAIDTDSHSRAASPKSVLRYFREQRWLHFLLLACVMSLAARSIYHLQWRWPVLLDNLVLDQGFALRGPIEPQVVAEELPHTRDIVVVNLPHQIERPVLALLLRKLRRAKIVAIDLMFADRAAGLDNDEKAMQFYRKAMAQWAREDAFLAQEIRRCGNVLLGKWPEESLPRYDTPAGGILPIARVQRAHGGGRRLEWKRPPDILWNSARYHGHFRVEPEQQDGIVRRVRLFAATPERVPAFGLTIAGAVLDLDRAQIAELVIQNNALQLGARRIPVDGHGQLLIDYVGGHESFELESNQVVYYRVLQMYPDNIDPGEDDFKDKIVIIGATDFKAKDTFPTPFGDMPGLQIHANIATTFLNPQPPLQPVGPWQVTLLALACSLLLVVPLLRWPLASSFAVALLEIVLIVLGAEFAFKDWRLVFPVSVPIFAVLLTYNAVALYEYGRARNLIGMLTDPKTAAHMMRFLSHLRLGGKEEEASAFFCDIRGYSTLSERLSPGEAMGLLNEYTEAIDSIVQKHGGRVIDFLGDGMFAIFQTSHAGPDFAVRAVEAALEAQSTFEVLQKNWQRRGVRKVEVGIAVHTGEMVIGVVGSTRRKKFGAVGDVVNVAARVQELSLHCGYHVLITGATLAYVQGRVDAVRCGDFAVKGREQTIEVWGIGHANESV